jgi:hypothetical protein
MSYRVTDVDPLDRLAHRLDAVRTSGSGWIARCPGHEDRTPSLSIRRGDDGRVLVHCHAGCETRRIVGALALNMRDLFATHDDAERQPVHKTASSADVRDFIATETRRRRLMRRLRHPHDSPHVRAADVNAARMASNVRFKLKLAPVRPLAWEGNAPHDCDPLWPVFFERARLEARWASPVASSGEIEIAASELAASWLHAEAQRGA